MNYAYILTLLLLSLSACGPGPSSDQQQSDEPALDPAAALSEDDILLSLSAAMTTDTSRAGRERNAIIGYALENLQPLDYTNSGLFYHILAPGEGEAIVWGDYLRAHYRGAFLDGKVFADSRALDRPLEFYVGNMIDGWNEGLQLIAPGGKMILLVPSALGYGADGLVTSRGDTLVPAHAILRFEIEVLERLERAE
ncbi:MAG: FKBP-type peptidyl-prolyl cis-trans isomerase [Lewinella sp.]|nr:FKBP-type peptidyl-prolyl cis-trans isomerase [Lewinella sp.]